MECEYFYAMREIKQKDVDNPGSRPGLEISFNSYSNQEESPCSYALLACCANQW